jgi:hypothetical protein
VLVKKENQIITKSIQKKVKTIFYYTVVMFFENVSIFWMLNFFGKRVAFDF